MGGKKEIYIETRSQETKTSEFFIPFGDTSRKTRRSGYISVFRLAYKPHSVPFWGFCPVLMESVFRLAYKPHSVQRLIPVYAMKVSSRRARLCDHLSEQPTRD